MNILVDRDILFSWAYYNPYKAYTTNNQGELVSARMKQLFTFLGNESRQDRTAVSTALSFW